MIRYLLKVIMLDISSGRKSFYFAKNWGPWPPGPPVAWALNNNDNNGNFSFIFTLNYTYKSHYYKGNLQLAGLGYRI